MITKNSFASRVEVRWLLSLCLAAGLVFGFGLLADEVTEGDTGAFDRRILLMFRVAGDPARLLGPPWLGEALRDATSLGSVLVLTLVVVTVLGYLTLTRNARALAFVLGAVLGGQAISTGLKLLFDRTRPDLIPGAPHVFTPSFPSGHAMLSAVTYLTLGALLAHIEPRKSVKVYFLVVAFSLTLMVGLSRVALGVHWPTDVLAGWCVGSAWALLCALVAARIAPQTVDSRPGT